MKSIHIIGAGGPAGVGLSRCLRDHYDVQGQDGSQWAELMMEIPINLQSQLADMVIAPPDSLTALNSFRPEQKQVDLCRDKAKTAEVLGKLAPKTYWERDTEGSGGSGAKMCSEYLPGKNYSVEFVFFNGEKVADFQKERLSYSVKSRTQGVENRGSSAVSVVTAVPAVYRRAQEALNKVAEHTGTLLHGFYGVDLKCDENGVPKVTEINAGRLLTASYFFFYATGYNLPLIGVKCYLDEEMPDLPDYPLGFGQIRQVGQEPRLFPPEVTATW